MTDQSRSGRPLGRPAREVDLDRVAAMRLTGQSWRSIAIAHKTPRRTLEAGLRVGGAQSRAQIDPNALPHAGGMSGVGQ